MVVFVYPSIVCLTMGALLSDQAIMIIFLAFLMVSIPIVIAHFGTFSIPPNALAASFLVNLCKYTNLVILLMGEGG